MPNTCIQNETDLLAGEPGFEPGLTESESVGLPLTYSPVEGRHLRKCYGEVKRGWREIKGEYPTKWGKLLGWICDATFKQYYG